MFISGGCKNGKSGHAQRIAKAMCPPGQPLYYVATMMPVDAEDTARISRHRGEREGWGFTTVEMPRDIHKLTDKCYNTGSFLIDSATALLMNTMFLPGGGIDRGAPGKLCRDFALLLPLLPHVVVVSDFIYSDAAIYDNLTDAYRCGLAQVDRALAGLCDVVMEAAAGNRLFFKGGELFKTQMRGALL